MEFREDPLASVIEEIATLLATGYLRLRKARTAERIRRSSSAPSGRRTILIMRRMLALQGAHAFNDAHEKGD